MYMIVQERRKSVTATLLLIPKVAPAELESVLLEHPKVEDAAVVGIPHPIAGEVPRAYVVPKHGCSLTEKDVQDFVSGTPTSSHN